MNEDIEVTKQKMQKFDTAYLLKNIQKMEKSEKESIRRLLLNNDHKSRKSLKTD